MPSPTFLLQNIYADHQGKLGARVGGNGVSGDYTMVINGSTVPGNFEASIGGSEVDSSYRAAYTWNSALAPGFNANLVTAGKFTTANNPEIAIDKQGSILGSLGSHRFDGRVTNDGRAVGQLLGNDNAWYPIRGILSKVIWKLPNASGGTDDVPGLAGNLYVTIASVEYPISIKLVGGDGKN